MPKSLKNEFYSSYRWKIYPFREHKVTGEPVSLWGSNCIDAEDREIKRWGKDGIHVQPCEMENWEMNRLSAAMTTKSKPWFLEWLIIHLANPGWCQENDRCECEVCLQEKKMKNPGAFVKCDNHIMLTNGLQFETFMVKMLLWRCNEACNLF